jgi:glycosyltransferase involved in cell wall biosynthesis
MATSSSRIGRNNCRHRSSLLILGVYAATDAYPNVYQKLRALRARPESREINAPLPMALLFGRSKSRLGCVAALMRFGVRFLIAHLRVLSAYLRTPTPVGLYAPYPSAGILWLLSWLPESRRPERVVADAFISLYDTVVEDRQLVSPKGLLSRLLLGCERRAYQYADVVVTDTELNAQYLRKTFGLPDEKVTAMPLSIDEHTYTPSPYSVRDGTCNVLFIGTFVPLQGADVIAHAIALLRNDPGVRFRLIGYGQNAPQAEAILTAAGAKNWSWEQSWQTGEALAAEIHAADICLGIFGSGAKTQRVWPLKNYAYMAVGRTLITADTRCARALLAETKEPPFVTVPNADPAALADVIRALAADPQRRLRLAAASNAYYDRCLRSSISIQHLEELFETESRD